MDPPFELPLRTEEHKGSTPVVLLHAPHKGGVEQLACLPVYPSEPGRAKRQLDHIALCVNAFPKLVEVTKRYRVDCVSALRTAEHDGYDVMASSWTDEIRKIDAAIGDPAKDVGSELTE